MSFEYTTEVSVRYDDLDTYGHVNNVRYGTYLEEARIDYLPMSSAAARTTC
ncbi:acyl-CoA thioesterase [Halomicroarcula sp. GCM10025709]|uniref:acyl-CoA thioesterase n=1 Tax=Halomicroarcula sp. GCM10025709 TaxID=3252669 RepID=UPI003623441E